MSIARWIVLVIFVALLAAPLLFSRERPRDADRGERLIIITPHNDQIRFEFERAFKLWHQRTYGAPAHVIWSIPGGTSDIRRMLEAQYTAALRNGRPVGGEADLLFGGGEAEHNALKHGVSVTVNNDRRHTSISAAIDFDQRWLDAIYGENNIGGALLYDPDGYWFGTALSSFGIVWNRDVLHELSLPEPRRWADLCDPHYFGWVGLANPAQSGSMRKSFATILQHHGWRDGWRILRRMAANSRFFASSASNVPIDATRGDVAAGVCIDFYARFQGQAARDAGVEPRLGYGDPAGETAIDADPISMLRGAPNPVLARRFIEFTLSDAGQALWQFPRRASTGHRLGPAEYELRRMPIRRSMYDEYGAEFVDEVNPFEFTPPARELNPYYWRFVPLLHSAMAIDTHEELRAAWRAIIEHPAYPHDGGLVTAELVADPRLKRMLELFDAMPTVPAPDGKSLALDDDSQLAAIASGWLEGRWRDAELWPDAAAPQEHLRARFEQFFNETYRAIVELAE